jgi:hypothetical protein
MPDAESQLATRRAWWRENRPAVAIDRIASAPFASTVFVERRGHAIRRRLLPKTRSAQDGTVVDHVTGRRWELRGYLRGQW